MTSMGSKVRPVKGRKCHYCDSPANSWDHIVPKSKGGRNAQWNRVPACTSCNRAKKDNEGWCLCVYCENARSPQPIPYTLAEAKVVWSLR